MLSYLLMLISLMSTGYTIDSPLYKVILSQKGRAQYIQYDIHTPPLREFTFCTWIRVYQLVNDQTIFSYVAQGNNQIIRLWLNSGGHHLKLIINGREATGAHVDILKDVWKHVCLSYQSDFGAWALYIDARIVTCEAAHTLYGYVLPSGGSVLIGYGTANNGTPNGFEGEIYGANMILTSTIKRKITIQNDPVKQQRYYFKNKSMGIKESKDFRTISDLLPEEIHNNFEMTQLSPFGNLSQNYIKFRTPNSFIAHKVGIVDSTPNKILSQYKSITRDVSDFSVNEKKHKSLFNHVFSNENSRNFSSEIRIKTPQMRTKTAISSLDNINIPKISEFETPPPPTSMNQNMFYEPSTSIGKSWWGNIVTDTIANVEMPPPPVKNNNVYGQWTNSKFADTVLNYLKTNNFYKKEHKEVPATIPLNKVLDNFPYASEFKQIILNPPIEFSRPFVQKTFHISKKEPQINVQILEDDLRSLILHSHAKTETKNVEITNRGKTSHDKLKYRHMYTKEFVDVKSSSENDYKPESFLVNQKYSFPSTLRDSNLLPILPFLKPSVQFVQDSQDIESKKIDKSVDMYTKSLSNRNKWHNVKLYSNDYTPRLIDLDAEYDENEFKRQETTKNNSKPSITSKYKPEEHLFLNTKVIINGKDLALGVSNDSDLPVHRKKIKKNDKLLPIKDGNTRIVTETVENFDKHVKLGNALNERHLIGNNEAQKYLSFVGGNELIPDINKYRSDIDNEKWPVPPSLGPKICKDVELYERVLYVKPEESIALTNILSSLNLKNSAIEFITQNYKRCSYTGSSLNVSQSFFINWNETPVKLFGGAYVKATIDFCGFF